MTITLRPAILEDCPALAEMHVEGWRTAYAAFMPADFLSGLNVAANERDFRDWIFNPAQPCIAWIAEVDDQAAGFVVAGRNEGDPPDYDAEIFKLFVRPGWQGQGIGQRLMSVALDDLRDQGYRKVAIWTFQQSRSGQFYHMLGYPVVFQTHIEFGGLRYAVDVYGGGL